MARFVRRCGFWLLALAVGLGAFGLGALVREFAPRHHTQVPGMSDPPDPASIKAGDFVESFSPDGVLFYLHGPGIVMKVNRDSGIATVAGPCIDSPKEVRFYQIPLEYLRKAPTPVKTVGVPEESEDE